MFDSHAAGGRIFLKKHRRNLSGVPCFDTNAELQKVDSSKQAQNVSKQPKDSRIFESQAENVFDSHQAGGRICDEKAGLCSLLRGDKTGGLSHKQKANSPLFRAKPTPKPKPQRLPL